MGRLGSVGDVTKEDPRIMTKEEVPQQARGEFNTW